MRQMKSKITKEWKINEGWNYENYGKEKIETWR